MSLSRSLQEAKFKPGDKVRISHGSGVDSGKAGTVVQPREVKTDGRGIPTNIQGAYSPVNWKEEVAVRLDDGSLITMFKNRLVKESRDESLFGAVAPLLDEAISILEKSAIAPGMEFEDEHGVWVVDRKARGTVDSWEIWLKSRGKGHGIVIGGSELRKYYKKVK